MVRRAPLLLAAFLASGALVAQTPREIPDELLDVRRVAADGHEVVVRIVRPTAPAGGDALPLVVVPGPAGAGEPGAAVWATYSMGVLVSAETRSRFPALVAEVPVVEPASPDALRAAVDAVVDAYPVDPGRIVIVGEGAGADAAWLLLAADPRRYAAAVLIGGNLDRRCAGALADTPLWIFHGEKDERAPVERTRSVVSAIWAAGGTRARYSEIRGAETVWVTAWQERRLLPWLFSQSRE